MVNFRKDRGNLSAATGYEIQALAEKHGLDCSIGCSLSGTAITVAWTPPPSPEDAKKIGKHDDFILRFTPTLAYRHASGWKDEYVVDLTVQHEAHPEFWGEPRPPKVNYLTLTELKAMPMANRVVGFVEDAMVGNFPAPSHICLGLGPALALKIIHDVPASAESIKLAGRAAAHRGPGMVIVITENTASPEADWHPSADKEAIHQLIQEYNQSAAVNGLPDAVAYDEFKEKCPACAYQLELTAPATA